MKINYRQMSIMLFLSFICLKFLVLPSVLYLHSSNTSWFVALILMIIDGIYALLLIDLMKKNQNKNINEFLKDAIGPVLTKLFLKFLSCFSEPYTFECNQIYFFAPLLLEI